MLLRVLIIVAVLILTPLILVGTGRVKKFKKVSVISGALLIVSLVVGSDPTKLGFYEGDAFLVFFITIPIALISGIVFLVSGVMSIVQLVKVRRGERAQEEGERY